MYEPKINPEAVMLGYLGGDPVKFGAYKGYSTRLTPPSKPKPKPEPAAKKAEPKRENPYLKK